MKTLFLFILTDAKNTCVLDNSRHQTVVKMLILCTSKNFG